jgi:hypothetical protein
MSADLAIRAVAALAAVVLVCAPAVPVVVAYVKANAERLKSLTTGWPQVLLAGALAYVAMFGLPKLPSVTPSPSVPEVVVPVPSDAMQKAVAGVHRALAHANPVDRAVWAQVWAKAALVASGDATDTEVVFTDTRALRAFNVIALRIGWRRLGGQEPGRFPGLAESTEQAFAAVLGTDVQPVTPELRQRYVDLCNALAWCGAGRG